MACRVLELECSGRPALCLSVTWVCLTLVLSSPLYELRYFRKKQRTENHNQGHPKHPLLVAYLLLRSSFTCSSTVQALLPQVLSPGPPLCWNPQGTAKWLWQPTMPHVLHHAGRTTNLRSLSYRCSPISSARKCLTILFHLLDQQY